MKERLKIKFVDFWQGFIDNDNYFYNLLSKYYDVELSDNPSIIIYSCYGQKYLNYDCVRIFYSAENIRPDFTGCDYAITFDLIDDPRHYRLPLYALYIGLWGQTENVLKVKSEQEARAELQSKSKFCCMLVSNPNSKKRIKFFHKLSAVKQVDSGGRYLNNVGGPVSNKLEFIRQYKFVFAFENSSYPGYVTEKLIEPCFIGSIPVYWCNPKVALDFNPKRFINFQDFPDEDAVVEKIMEIDRNDELAVQMLSEPIFNGNVYPEWIREENVINFFNRIIELKDDIVPVAQTAKSKIHLLRRQHKKIKDRIFYHLGLNFR
jgi:hypothetical protein